MQKKVSVLLIPVLILLSIGFISAANCEIVARSSCVSPNHIVMGVSSLTNAHGEFPDQGTYNYVLCCDFGDGDTACSGTNKIIGLSDSTNAHAEIPSQTTYTTGVCYGDFVCVSLDTTGGDCSSATSGDYPIDVMSLSSYTNGHIGALEDYSSVSICCKSPSAPQSCSLTNAYWSLDGTNAIEEGETALNGQEVSLIVEGANCYGQTISFEVTEGGTVSQGSATTQPSDVTFTTKAMGTWTAEWVNDVGTNPEYYFVATVAGSSPAESVETEINLIVEEETYDDYCIDITTCAGYDEEHCGADTCDVAATTVEVPEGETCGAGGYSCSCVWDEGTCKGEYSYSSSSVCGNEIVEGNEQCDGSNLDSKTCSDLDDYTGGTLACSSYCTWDITGCTGEAEAICGDDIINAIGEDCDGTDLGGKTCQSLGFNGGTLSCNGCSLDKSGCYTDDQDRKYCGDGIVDLPNDGYIWEQCDGSNLDSKTCSDLDDYTGGTLACSSYCTWDITGCTGEAEAICGDDIINAIGEDCDGSDLQGLSCQSLGYGAGTLSCTDGCSLDLSGCTGELETDDEGTCIVTQEVTSECNEDPEGWFIYSWTGEWEGSLTAEILSSTAYLECLAGGDNTTIECPAEVELSFFTTYNVIFTVALIALFYFFLIQKQNTKKKRNRFIK